MRESRVRDWLVITVETPPDQRDVALAALMDVGADGMEERADGLVLYLPATDQPAALRSVESALASVGDFVVRSELRPNEDWSRQWKRGLKPRRIGTRLVVTPSWCKPRTRKRDIVLVIDPEMAFGTGEHATTRACLRLLENAVRAGDRVLDVGTGSAILAIAAARLGAVDVLAVEGDIDAIENAGDNVARNFASTQVTIRHAFVDDSFLRAEVPPPFDLIVGNVLSSVLVPLLHAFRASLSAGGRLILSGILAEESGKVIAAASAAGFRLALEDREDEWWSALLVQQPSAGAVVG
jgi:ribosomal protein L11 methyltransferase